MSESKTLGVTIKAPESERYASDNPWFVFEGEPQTIYGNIVQTFGIENPPATLAELVLVAQGTVSAIAAAVRGGLVAAAVPAQQYQQPVQSQGPPPPWGQTPAAQQQGAAVPAPAAAPPVQNGPRLHPTDTCTLCGQRPQEKDVFRKSDQKKFEFWVCPNQRNRDDGHYSEFRN